MKTKNKPFSTWVAEEFITNAISNLYYDHNNPANIINNNNGSIPEGSDMWKDVESLIDVVCEHEYNPDCNRIEAFPYWKEFYNSKDPFKQ